MIVTSKKYSEGIYNEQEIKMARNKTGICWNPLNESEGSHTHSHDTRNNRISWLRLLSFQFHS